MPKPEQLTAKDFQLVSPKPDAKPSQPATAGHQTRRRRVGVDRTSAATAREAPTRRAPPPRRSTVGWRTPRTRATASSPTRSGQHNSERAGPQRPARRAAGEEDAGLRVVQGLLLRRPALRPEDDGPAAAQGRLRGDRGDRARADREDRRARAARALRDPAGRPRGAEDRPEADPRRLEAARVDGDLPRRRTEPVHRNGAHRPGPADVEDAADPAHARRSLALDLRLRAQRHPHRPDRPPGPGDARVPDRARVRPHDHLAQVRSLDHDHLGQRQRALDRRRGRHRDDQRRPRARPPGPGHPLRVAGHATCSSSRARCSRTRSSR